VNAVGIALDAPLTVFAQERVWIVHQKPQADCPHLMLELKLHVKLDRVTARPVDGIRRRARVECNPNTVHETLWGTREFALYDLDRNALTFYRHLTSAERERRMAESSQNYGASGTTG
jgi:hypothetical protein